MIPQPLNNRRLYDHWTEVAIFYLGLVLRNKDRLIAIVGSAGHLAQKSTLDCAAGLWLPRAES
jgi:hypothetical protein